jgi:phage baseplate assembly protein W
MYDIKFQNSDIVINELYEIETVTELEETKQDLEHRLMCVKGSDRFHPDYGVDWLRIKRTTFNKPLIEHEIKKALKTHSEVKTIDRIDISAIDAERKTKIKVYVTLKSEAALTAEVSV